MDQFHLKIGRIELDARGMGEKVALALVCGAVLLGCVWIVGA